MKQALHFGAGNIGRGFVGFLLSRAGYELTFADVNAELIDQLANATGYTVHEVGENSQTHEITGFHALNSATHEAEVADAIAHSDVVTTAVGPNILRFVAPTIKAGLQRRAVDASPLVVMACENAIGATDILRDHLRDISTPEEWQELSARAIFANTAVDRIVPGQAVDAGLDVTVESYFEWAIEAAPFQGDTLEIPGVTWVPDLKPYIERKLFTVNTGHATTAYYGFVAGYSGLAEALLDPEIRARVYSVLQETKALIVAKHDFDPAVQEEYLQKILTRFANPHLVDTVGRVGRQPLRKVSRHERFIGPAAELAERGIATESLVDAVGALLRFDVADDPESVELRALLDSVRDGRGADEVTEQITGLASNHPLFAAVRDRVAAVAAG
ncbi:mannitol-1-phosphate 5-dehydrogenase [Lysinibacter sp. HNR]|uniref:mannitol-1-phosphate 5-dehydrogenase n=1 Tax=Lysinibacter sp. HNR TaxID=3031408 RepID=UPI0024355A4C|nr:mannitol-1-phosphate 5-dehydrogenase [Lysinibacter sp. HNR]WGD36724.1 mannitol-1-phosphate 5-dehydrogenase [Lysinibacter sp. HNR]